MATIAENIQTLRSIKSDIKQAITDKGGSVSNDFKTYAQAITNLPSGGGGGTENEDGLITRTISGTYYNNRVSVVGSYVFDGCSALQSIDFPNCKKIYEKAFDDCSALQYIDLPNCLYISDYAFYNCNSLISFSLSNCISLGNYVFQNCFSLIYFNLPLCEYLGYGALYRCSALQYIDLPKCSYVRDYAFFSCQKLSLINLPKCTSLGGYACYQCSSISTIKIPVCSYISYCAFQSCTNLKEVYLNSVTSVTTITSDTFSYCPNLTSVYVPASLVNAFKTAQYWSSIPDKIVAYREPTEPTKYPPLIYSTNAAGSTITVNGETVTLEQGDNITLDYPNEITSVEAKDNEALTYLQIPNTVTSINDNAFEFCIGLESVNIPSGVTSIRGTFNACSALTSVTLPDTLQTIGDSAFMECSSLTSITIPSSVTMIESYAFDYCEALTDFNFNGTKAQWGAITLANDWKNNAAFTVVHCTDGDVSLEEPIQPIQPTPLIYSTNAAGSTITVNGQSMTLEQGDNLTLEYPTAITSVIGQNNTALTYIQIPNTVTEIEAQAFRSCSSLVSINIPDSVTSIGNAAFSFCAALTSVNIPDSVTSIGNAPFMSCSSLVSINIPDGVTSIGNSAFYECSKLASINIPDSVTSIGNSAFSDCSKLTNFNYNGTKAQWSSITKDETWKYGAAFTVVHCTDGDVTV